MLQETLLNAEGYKELQDELENLKTVGRKEAAEKIKVARSYATFQRTQSTMRR